jgi:hypothetical protein
MWLSRPLEDELDQSGMHVTPLDNEWDLSAQHACLKHACRPKAAVQCVVRRHLDATGRPSGDPLQVLPALPEARGPSWGRSWPKDYNDLKIMTACAPAGSSSPFLQ